MILDPLYMLLLVVTASIGFIASARVKRTFSKWDKVTNTSGKTGAEIAREILRRSNISSVTVEQVDGFLSDHYDPSKRVLRLSPKVYSGRSVAAAGVAAHEVGHALQHAYGYWPLGVRTKLAPAAALGSNLSNIAIIGGLRHRPRALAQHLSRALDVPRVPRQPNMAAAAHARVRILRPPPCASHRRLEPPSLRLARTDRIHWPPAAAARERPVGVIARRAEGIVAAGGGASGKVARVAHDGLGAAIARASTTSFAKVLLL